MDKAKKEITAFLRSREVSKTDAEILLDKVDKMLDKTHEDGYCEGFTNGRQGAYDEGYEVGYEEGYFDIQLEVERG